MNCYTELTRPTAVSHSVSLPFLHGKANNLVVAKTSLLQIFELKNVLVTESDSEPQQNGTTLPQDLATDTLDRTFTADVSLQRLEHATKLVLVGEFPLAGTVSSLARVKLPTFASGGEALLVAFRDAKLVLVEWDPEKHALHTVSIHYYENSLSAAPWAPDLNQCPLYISVDPRHRCAVLRFGPRHLAILPFKQPEDDLAGDDFDSDLDDPGDKTKPESKLTNGDVLTSKSPYGRSFVLPLTVVDPEIVFCVHLAFLYEYREPTFGVLYSTRAPSSSMTLERRDLLRYKVFTLDLEQQASTTILSVSNLPTSLQKVIPLPLPVGGVLLLGNNELVHIDQAGKSTAIAVNEFAKVNSSFGMTDQSSLDLKLEGAVVEQLGDAGDLLLVLVDGDLAIVSFKMDGRLVAGLSLHKVSSRSQGGVSGPHGVSCSSNLGRGRIFLGSEDSNSLVIGWARKTALLSRKRSHADMLKDESDVSFDEDDIADEDDLYGDDLQLTKTNSRSANAGPIVPDTLMFRLHDQLPNLAPGDGITFGTRRARGGSDTTMTTNDDEALQLVYPNGRGSRGGVAVSSRQLEPRHISTLKVPSATAVWAFHASPPAPRGMIPKGQKDSEGLSSAEAGIDRHLIASVVSPKGNESQLYQIKDNKPVRVDDSDFESEGITLDVGTLSSGTRIVQIKQSEIRCYNSDFGLEQILPIIDENTDEELQILSVSFCDPYLMVIREDSSVCIFELNGSAELEEIERGDGLLANPWLSGCIYKPSGDSAQPLAFVLSAQGSIHVFELPDLATAVYKSEAFPYLPGHIMDDFAPRRYWSRETLAEIIVADIGDDVTSPFIILRTSQDDIVMYQPYHYPHPPRNSKFVTNLRWAKVSQPKLSSASDILASEPKLPGKGATLRRVANIGGYSTVVHVGRNPGFVLKESSSAPRLVPLASQPITSLTAFHFDACEHGFISVDVTGNVEACTLQPHTRYGDTGWPTRQVAMREEVTHVAYHQSRKFYVIATATKQDFHLPEDDHHKDWANEQIRMAPKTNRTTIKILSADKWNVISTLELDRDELCLSLIIANLETSEKTHERKDFIAVGTVIATGEDQSARGRIHIIDIIDVVPEPDKPETGFKLKTWAQEEVKGAVTALSEIGPQGFLLAAQGQKCLVRGLIEEQKLLPVAFMDVQTYVTSARVLPGTGLFLLADILKGVWFGGYTEEPYKMMLFGKSNPHMEVVAAEFLPQDKQLSILAADSDKNIHVLQYDPESAKSQTGRRLVHRSTFHSGHFPISMHLLPSTLKSRGNGDSDSEVPEEAPSGDDEDGMEDVQKSADKRTVASQRQVLVVTQTGVIALITPIDEIMYLRLNAMQTYLTAQLSHACGLNPRGYRAVESERMGIKGIVDGTLLMRWAELPKQRRVEVCSRIGSEDELLRSDLEAIGGGGLGYL